MFLVGFNKRYEEISWSVICCHSSNPGKFHTSCFTALMFEYSSRNKYFHVFVFFSFMMFHSHVFKFQFYNTWHKVGSHIKISQLHVIPKLRDTFSRPSVLQRLEAERPGNLLVKIWRKPLFFAGLLFSIVLDDHLLTER